MKNTLLFLLPVSLLFHSCTVATNKDSIEKWKNEILETEQNFAQMAKEEGISKAFQFYAADDAVLNRNDSLVKGIENIKAYFNNQISKDNDVSLTWKPDFVDVAISGDIGYTYGHYTYSYFDSSGSRINNTGIFHTVWKRQDDNNWRFVWD